jgi:hypothetical protein
MGAWEGLPREATHAPPSLFHGRLPTFHGAGRLFPPKESDMESFLPFAAAFWAGVAVGAVVAAKFGAKVKAKLADLKDKVEDALDR